MIIRKIRKNEIVSTKKIIGRAVIILVGFAILKGGQYLFHIGVTLTPDRVASQEVGARIHTEWYISVDNNFPHYTHSLIDGNKDTIGLKSASVNLNDYKGSVEIFGTLEKFLKNTPIVEVDTIKLADQWLIVKNNTYFFTKDFLYLDFSDQPQLSAIRSGNNVVILYDHKPVVQVERFVCGKILKGKTCTVLMDEYNATQKDNFQSLRWYTFYKHTDNVRIVFDETLFGYVFKNIDDDMMLKLSNMIRIVNKDFILDNKLPQLKKACAQGNENLEKVKSAVITYNNPSALWLEIRGASSQDRDITCTVVFDIWNEWAIKKANME